MDGLQGQGRRGDIHEHQGQASHRLNPLPVLATEAEASRPSEAWGARVFGERVREESLAREKENQQKHFIISKTQILATLRARNNQQTIKFKTFYKNV